MSKTLAIDIGNTTISFGVFRGKKLVSNFKISTGNRAIYRNTILRQLNKGKIKTGDITKIIICSVVPKETIFLKPLLSKLFNKRVLEVTKDSPIPIKNRYEKPKQVGQDRLINAYAGLKIYGRGLILVDFGTALTLDIVSKKGEYLGGLIFPGLDLSLKALHKGTALLPIIKVSRPKSLVGKDTRNSINNGVIFGLVGATDTIISRLQKQFRGYKVIATGGNAEFLKSYSKKIKIVRPFLTLEGLNLLR